MVDKSKKSFFGKWPSSQQVVTPEALLTILESDTSEIESIEFLPPRIDSGGFGLFKVHWEFPKYPVEDV